MEWIKVSTAMFEHEKMQIINSMPENDLIIYVWIGLLLHAGKTNDDGKVYISKNVPYSIETLSIIFARSKEDIECALNTLRDLNMIIIDDKSIIKIKNWTKYQCSKAAEKNREQSKIRMRNKRKRDKEKTDEIFMEGDDECYADVTEEDVNEFENVTPNKREIKNKEKDKDKDIYKKERRKSKVVSLQERKGEEVNEEAVEILNHYESIIGKTGVFKFEPIVLAISQHGADNVRMAFDKAIEAGKITMRYVNGILRNWAREGYPKEGEVEDGNRGANADGGKFKDIKPPEPKVYKEDGGEKLKGLI